MKTNKIIFIMFIGLTGCSRTDSTTELNAYIANVKTHTVGQIEPLPEVKPYETFVYAAQDLRNPFSHPDFERTLGGLPSDNGLRPDVNRRQEALESFPIDALRMLGTLEKNGKRWAIIRDSDGAVHRVTKGNYMGQNYGRIDSVTEGNMQLTEIVPDGRGGWMERKATIALVTE